jgi:hypothetical protein
MRYSAWFAFVALLVSSTANAEPMRLIDAQLDAVTAGASDAQLNRAWGDITSQAAQLDNGQPGIGEHASSPPGVEPGEGRQGVGNVSKTYAPLSEGGQGEHAIDVGGQLGLTCQSCS